VIELRRATYEDLTTIQALYRLHLGQMVDKDWLRKSSSSSENILCVFQVDEVLADFIHAVWSGGPYELFGICVRPELRRRGLADAGMKQLLSELSARKVTELWLEVRANNHGALHLYTKTGAIETGVRARYYPDGTDAILMTYVLDSMS